MKRSLYRIAILLSLAGTTLAAKAAEELILNVYKNDEAATGITAILDGKTKKVTDRNGLASFDLGGGAHSIQLLDQDKELYSFRFDSARGQLADISVSLSDNAKPVVATETYFNSESASARASAPTGIISGTVRSNGMPVADATVSITGTGISTETDEQGRYQLQVPRGIYQLDIQHQNLGNVQIPNYRVVSNVTKGSDFSISQIDSSIEEVVVLAKFNASAFQEDERYSTNVVDTMGIEQIMRFGDTTVASSIARAPGVTVQDDKFVFIRGLGGRYITTTLNGATMPSTNPTRRTVPLDLFPSNFVEQLDVRKTFVPSMPGESTGGNLVINTRSFPDQRAGTLSFNMGYLSGLTGNKAYVDPNDGDWDWIGIDDGSHDKEYEVTAIAEALKYSDFYSPQVKQQLGQIGALAQKDGMDYKRETATPNIDMGVNFGDIYSFTNTDAELGYFAAANYKNKWTQRDNGVSRTYEGGGERIADNFTFEENTNTVELNGLLSVGLNIGDNTFKSNTLLSRVTEDRVRVTDGVEGDEGLNSVRSTMEYVERQFLSQQFTGQHLLGDSDRVTIDWQGTASQATRDAPDRRDVRFDLPNPNGIYQLEVGALVRRYDDLTDNNYDASTDLEYLLGSTSNLEHSIAFGVQAIYRDRDSDSASYGFDANPITVSRDAPNLKVSDVINTGTITGDRETGYTFNEKTLPSDSYEADMELNSFYSTYDVLWKSTYQFIIGARYEDFNQTTKTFSIDDISTRQKSNLDEDTILPSLGFNWFYSDDQQLRFAVTQTVSRPDFKETSNAVFYDPEFDFRVRGNPDLKITDIINYDVRWENYLSDTDSISVALFYKDLSDPIERVVLPASGTAANSRTFQNAKSAEIYGIEFDGRKDIPLNKALTHNLYFAMNASWIKSEVELLNSDTRELQGQPEYTFNLILGYDDILNGHEITLLFNQNGETIVDVGLADLDDIKEQPRLDVNINYKYYITDDLTFDAKVKNLLNSEVKYTQGGDTFVSYEKGVEFKAGIDWKF